MDIFQCDLSVFNVGVISDSVYYPFVNNKNERYNPELSKKEMGWENN